MKQESQIKNILAMLEDQADTLCERAHEVMRATEYVEKSLRKIGIPYSFGFNTNEFAHVCIMWKPEKPDSDQWRLMVKFPVNKEGTIQERPFLDAPWEIQINYGHLIPMFLGALLDRLKYIESNYAEAEIESQKSLARKSTPQQKILKRRMESAI